MPTCAQTTKDGHKCTRTCKKGSKYCWQHQSTSKKSPKRRSSPKKSPNKMNRSPEEIQKKFCSCISQIKAKQASNKSGKQVNVWAVCTKSTGRISNSCKQYEK